MDCRGSTNHPTHRSRSETFGNGSATWSTIGDPTIGSLTEVTVSDDDGSLERADLFFGNETGTASTVSTSDDPSLLGKEIYLGDLDPANDNNDPWGEEKRAFTLAQREDWRGLKATVDPRSARLKH